jgi:cyanophycin synthetase
MPDIKIKRIRVLRGANIWAHQPVVDALVDIGPYEEMPSDSIEGFTDRLFEAIPSLITHRCSEGHRGGFLKRMRDGTYMGHIIEHVALELQCLAGMDVAYGKTRSAGRGLPGQYHVVIEYLEGHAGLRSVEVAAEGCEALACAEPYDFGRAIEEIREIGEYHMPGPATLELLDAARRRGIPWFRLRGRDHVQLGYGKHGARVEGGKVSGAGGNRRKSTVQEGQAAEYYDKVIDKLFPGDERGRIPVIAVTGTNGKTTVTRMIGHIMREAGYHVGITTTDGIYLDGALAFEGDCSGPQSAEDVLASEEVEVAVLETARGGILRSGLAFDVCDVGVLLNVSEDHIGLAGVNSVEDMAAAKGVVIESVRRKGYGVLNADDPLVADMARYCDGTVTYFSPDPTSARLVEHVGDGGMAVTVVEGWVVLQEGGRRNRVVQVAEVPATLGGLAPFQVSNVLAAAAAAWGAGVAPEVIGRALQTFRADAQMTPGRFNLFEGPGYAMLVDFAHNPAAMRALCVVVREYAASKGFKRLIGSVAAPGDRRNAQIKEVARIAADTFDVLIVHDDDDVRGRAPGEVPGIMAAVARRRLAGDMVIPVVGEFAALEKALEITCDGDLTVICAVQVPETLRRVREHLAAAGVQLQASG